MDRFLSFFNTKAAVFTALFATALFTLFFTNVHNENADGYILGDWLINYQDGGFKRRGLSGTLFFLLQDFTGIKLASLVLIFQLTVISLFFYYYFKLIQYKEATLLYLSLLLSSIGFIGIFNCVDYVGKKEFIVFFLFAFFMYHLNRKTLTKWRENTVVFALGVTMFFHEITLFFVPYFLIALYLNERKIEWMRYLKFGLVVFVPAVLILIFGKEINEGHSLEILKERGVVLSRGIFFWDINERVYIKEHWDEYVLYFISFAVTAFHLWFYLKYQKDKKLLSILLLLAFVVSLPLFYLAIDWGRWMYIHMIFIIVLFAMFLNDSPKIWASEKLIFNTKFCITSVIILFSLCYRVEMSGRGFTWEGFLYRTLVVPAELINKML